VRMVSPSRWRLLLRMGARTDASSAAGVVVGLLGIGASLRFQQENEPAGPWNLSLREAKRRGNPRAVPQGMEVATHAHGLDPWVAALLAMTFLSCRRVLNAQRHKPGPAKLT
jgi:hypothetical protein